MSYSLSENSDGARATAVEHGLEAVEASSTSHCATGSHW